MQRYEKNMNMSVMKSCSGNEIDLQHPDVSFVVSSFEPCQPEATFAAGALENSTLRLCWVWVSVVRRRIWAQPPSSYRRRLLMVACGRTRNLGHSEVLLVTYTPEN